MSDNYKHKMIKREEREPFRKALRWAKEQCAHLEPKTLEYRHQVTTLRKQYLEKGK